MKSLGPAIERLRLFRQSWNEGDLIDEESGLTAGDLDVVLIELEARTPENISEAPEGTTT